MRVVTNSSPPSSFVGVLPVLFPYERTGVRVVTSRPSSSSLELVSPALMPWEMACCGKEPPGVGFGGSVVRLEALRRNLCFVVMANSPQAHGFGTVSPVVWPYE